MKQHMVYMLTNISKDSGRRFYIGSKQEASVEEYDGVMTILDRKDTPYYSSTTSYEMLEDVKSGDILQAEVLEYVGDKLKLTEIENAWIRKYNAVDSNEFYNKAYAVLNAHYDGDALANKYGETIAQLSSRNSSWGKRDGRAKESGFDNFGDMYIWIHEQKQSGKNGKEVSEALGKERHFAFRTIKGMDIDKAKEQIIEYKDSSLQTELRKMVYNNCSPMYACELLGLEIAAGRILLGDFKQKDKTFVASLKRGMSKDEMEKRVVQVIYDNDEVGYGFKQAANELGLNLETVKRYFIRYVKANMKRPE